MRKGLLGDLSSLVKTSKKIQDNLQSDQEPNPVFGQLDELVLKAFKLVTRAVRFLDIWAQDAVSLSFDLGDASSNRPLTPPSDAADPSAQPPATSNHDGAASTSANHASSPVSQASANATREDADSATQPPRNLNRLSVAFSIPSDSDALQSPLFPPQPQAQSKRVSVTHRLSYTGKSQSTRKQNLASERLNTAHDSFLGFIGSFIGLHLQSRSSEELTLTTQQSVVACRQLLAIVEEIWDRDSRRSEPLEQAREAMYTRLTDLVQATKDMFSNSEPGLEDEEVIPESGEHLVAAATSCVRSAGECVTEARLVIERIGDFEFESEQGLSDAIFEQMTLIPTPAAEEPEMSKPLGPTVETEKPLPAPPVDGRKMLPPLVIAGSKPLPQVPQSPDSPSTINHTASQSSQPAKAESPTIASLESSRSSLPPLNQLPTPHLPQPSPTDYTPSPASATQRFFSKSIRADSVNASMADSSSTYRYSMRGDTNSILSQTSTRATTPDHSPVKKDSSQTLVSSFGSASELRSTASEDVAAAEEQLLETTYAHELIFNKDGQIYGGSLPALVEQLTTHESTPDAVLVTAFFLTFRLFTTPVDLAQCLIDRFDHIGESQTIGVPVRLRVYNVFKGWLETHWVGETDIAALGIILSFAMGKLRSALPAAGKRLAELTSKVTDIRSGALVPRLVSTLGKTGASSAVFTSADNNVPSPIISRSQINALKAWKEGKAQCSILDFDPLELARQFTIIGSKIYCSIQPEELLAQEWLKKTSLKAVNVRAMSTLSNDLTNVASDTILQSEDAKRRAVIIKQWVKVAVKCLELNNYDSLMAIVCSLNSSMVLRLKRTWELVSTKTKGRLEELKTITDHGRNYGVLRQRLNNHVASCIPFVGMILTDLTFVDAGNPMTRELPGESGQDRMSVINFDKHMKTAKIIGQLQSFQVPYRLAAVPEMQDWMDAQIQRVRASDQANVQSQYRRSLLLEPREAPQFVKAAPSPVEGGTLATLTADSRTNSKDRFDFLNFHFSTNPVKDR